MTRGFRFGSQAFRLLNQRRRELGVLAQHGPAPPRGHATYAGFTGAPVQLSATGSLGASGLMSSANPAPGGGLLLNALDVEDDGR